MSDLTPEKANLPVRLYRLRWRFEFYSGKATRRGIWDGSSGAPGDSAWAIDKAGLARVMIEGEDRMFNIGEQKIFVDIAGQDYASMQWEAYSKIPAFFKGNGVTPQGVVSGLSILTASEKITVTVDGTVSREPLSDYQKSFSIHEHSMGDR